MRQIALLILILLTTSCQSKGDRRKPQMSLKVDIDRNIVSFNQDKQELTVVNLTSHWGVEITYKGVQSGWCKISEQSGSRADIMCDENISTESRELTITVTSSGQAAKANITQLGTPISDIVHNGIELPDVAPNRDELFVSHYITLNNRRQRNYSMLFDKHKRIAYWVAYPLNQELLERRVERSDIWSIDPSIPKRNQLSSTISTYNPPYDRGHQIPSADRLCSEEANRQTFFYSNITPQVAQFNQGAWLRLEEMVRYFALDCDTLYVVTGAVLQTASGNEKIKYVADKNRVQAAVPNYYFKVLLRSKGGVYDAIGFWFDHKKRYPNRDPSIAEMRSVDEIEALTGYDLFKSLPKSTQDEVESIFNPERWIIEQ